MITMIEGWDGYAPDREMDGMYWVPDSTEQAVIAQWHPREEYWSQTVHTGHMEAEVKFILPVEAARKWGYVLPCQPPAEVAP